jgi:hypothetical protein
MNNNLEFENEDPSPDSIEDNHPRTNYGEGYGGKETLEEVKPPIGEFIINNAASTQGNDGAYYHYSEVCKLLRLQQERMYSEEDMRLAIKKARDISDGKDCFDAEDISGCTEVCTYDWKFNMSEDLIIEQFKKK